MLLLDGEGKERARLEGYLPNNDFNAALRNGLGRIALFTRNTPMRNDGTAMWLLAMGIRILHRRRCTGGLWRATRPRTITPYWAKSPRNFEPYIRPACGRASPFRGCINTNRSTGKDRFARTPHLTGKPAVIHPGRRPGRRNEGWLPENLLIKWRSHAGCGSNLSTVCLL